MPLGNPKGTVTLNINDASAKQTMSLPFEMEPAKVTSPAESFGEYHQEPELKNHADECCSDGWGAEQAEEEASIAWLELKQALWNLLETLFSGSFLASLMGFIVAVVGFIRLLSFTNVWQDAAIWVVGLIIFGAFRGYKLALE